MPRKSRPRRALGKPAGAFHHGDLRRALLEGAMRLLEREGPLGVGLRAAARLAGVSQAAPYRHFADKETMLAALAEQGFRELTDRMTAAARGHANAREALLAIGETYVSLAAERPNLFRLMFGPTIQAKDRFPPVHEAGMRAYQVLLDTIAAGQRAGVIRGRDPATLALAHWSAVHGVASLFVDGRLQAVAERLSVAGPPGARAIAHLVCEELLAGSRPT